MSEHLNRDTLTELLNCSEQACLSLYMPTYRAFPDSTQNAIRYRNLLGTLREQLSARFPDKDAAALLKPFEDLQNDNDFWQTPRDGLAVLGGEAFFRAHKLNSQVEEQAVVDDQPYLSPLLQITQTADQFQLLALSRDGVKLFEGNRDRLFEVALDQRVPQSQTDALGSELTEPDQSGHPDGFGAASVRGDPMMHAAGGPGKEEEIDKDREKFFRAVDRAITDVYSKPSGLPLLLVALPDNQTFFRQVSHNTQLLEDRIEIDPGALDANALRQEAADVMERQNLQRLNEAHASYGSAKGENLASEDVREVGKAAMAGRIALLLVEAGRAIPGSLNQDSGEVVLDEQGSEARVLEDITATAMRHGADVLIVPAQRMPSTTGVAATFRF